MPRLTVSSCFNSLLSLLSLLSPARLLDFTHLPLFVRFLRAVACARCARVRVNRQLNPNYIFAPFCTPLAPCISVYVYVCVCATGCTNGCVYVSGLPFKSQTAGVPRAVPHSTICSQIAAIRRVKVQEDSMAAGPYVLSP